MSNNNTITLDTLTQQLGYERKQSIPGWVLFANHARFVAFYAPDGVTREVVEGPYENLSDVRLDLSTGEDIIKNYRTREAIRQLGRVWSVGYVATSTLMLGIDAIFEGYQKLKTVDEYITSLIANYDLVFTNLFSCADTRFAAEAAAIIAGGFVLLKGLTRTLSYIPYRATKRLEIELSPEAEKYRLGSKARGKLEAQLIFNKIKAGDISLKQFLDGH